MDRTPSQNIFDEAGRKRLKRNEEKFVPTESSKRVLPSEAKPLVSINESDIDQMFERMVEIRRSLDKKSDELKDAIAVSREDVSKFFQDPKNFSPEEWAIIQESRLELEKKVWAVVGKDPAKVRQKQIEDKESKLRKGKTVAARRNWIPIR